MSGSRPFLRLLVMLSLLWTTVHGGVYGAPKKTRFCDTKECIAAGNEIQRNLNESADPCEDFFQFSCGGYIAAHPLAPDVNSVSTFNDLINTVRTERQTMLESTNTPTFETETKMKGIYQQCVDIDARSAQQGRQLLDLLEATVGGWPLVDAAWNPAEFQLMDALVAAQEYMITPFVRMNVFSEPVNRSAFLLTFFEPVFFANKAQILGPDNQTLIDNYLAYMTNLTRAVLTEAGSSVAVEDLAGTLQELVDFEILLIMADSNVQQEFNLQLIQLGNLSTVFAESNSLDSLEYVRKCFAKIGRANDISDSTVVGSFRNGYLASLDHLLAGQEKRGDEGKVFLANYIGWKVVDAAAQFLSDEYISARKAFSRNAQVELLKRGISVEETPIAWACSDIVLAMMPMASSALYVRDFVPADLKSQGLSIFGDVVEGFRQLILDASWMDEETRSFAQIKLDAMYAVVAYADTVKDNLTAIDQVYAEVQVGGTFFDSVFDERKVDNHQMLESLFEPFVRGQTFTKLDDSIVNAFYYYNENGLFILAAIMKQFFFQPTRPQYLNYGGLGAAMGHEISHGFDNIGSLHDDQSRLRDWWTMDTFMRFNERGDALVAQYSNYTIASGHADGELTLPENVADNAGLKAAFLAYQRFAERQNDETAELRLRPLKKYSFNQLFFMSYGQLWCENNTDKYETYVTETGPHSLGRHRINGVVVNMPEFAEVFDCPVGSPMNPPVKNGVW